MCSEKFFSRRIEKLALKLYKARGNSPGSEKEDWLKAERTVKRSFMFRLFTLLARLKKPVMAISILGAVIFLLVVLATGLRGTVLLKQGSDLEPGDRPLVEIEMAKINIIKKEVAQSQLPELRFAFDGKLLNYGRSPAYVKNVEFILKDIELDEFAPAVLRPRDRQKQLMSFDLSNGVGKTLTWEPVIDIVSIETIMRAYVDNKDVRSKKSAFWRKKDKEITEEFKKHIQPFSVIAQVEYYAVDDKKLEKPYYYSLQCKVDRKLNCFYYKCAKAKWLKVSDDGVVRRIQ